MIFDQMRAIVADVMPKIYAHPFNQELALGTLALEKFIFYLSHYLNDKPSDLLSNYKVVGEKSGHGNHHAHH